MHLIPRPSRRQRRLPVTWLGKHQTIVSVGGRNPKHQPVIFALAVLLLIILFSRYVLLAIVVSYVLYGLLSRVASIFWRRSDAAEAKIEPASRSSR